jgi:hypothetical protein
MTIKDVTDYVQKKAMEIVIAGWGLTYLKSINDMKDKFPSVWSNVISCQELIVQLQNENARINKVLYADSVRRATIKQMKHKP